MRRLRLGWPLLFGAATLLAPRVRSDFAPLHSDTARDLLIARDFAEGRFTGAGANTSFGNLLQGALWPHILSLRVRFGLSLAAFERTIDVLLAVGAALVAWFAIVALQRRPGFIVWALWLFPTLAMVEFPILWNPTLLPLAVALFFVALVRGVQRGSTGAFFLASISLGCSIELHVANALMLPCFAALVVAYARRPFFAATLAGLGTLEVFLVVSPGALDHNLHQLLPHLRWAIVGGVLVLAVGVALRRRARRGAEARRIQLALLAVCVYFTVALLMLSRLGGRQPEWRYLAIVATPAAVLLGGLLERHLPFVVQVAVLGAAMVLGPRERRTFRLQDADPIARTLYADSTFDDLFRHLRGPESFALLGTVGALEEVRSSAPPPRDEDVLVLSARRRELPPGLPSTWKLVELDSRRVAVIVRYAPRVDTTAFRLCRDGSPACTDIHADPSDLVGARSTGWSRRAYPAIGEFRRAALAGPSGKLLLRFAVRAGKDPVRVTIREDQCTDWIVTRATGALTPLPAASVTIAAHAAGELELAAPECSLSFWIPPLAEAPPEDAPLARLLERG